MKKLISVVLMLVLLASLHTSSYSEENIMEFKEMTPELEKLIEQDMMNFDQLEEKDNIATVIINEYDYIAELQKKTDKELRELGLDKKQVKELRSINFHEKFKKLKYKSNKELKSMGYSEENIVAIHNYDGSIASIQAASASLIASYRIDLAYYDGYETQFRIQMSWRWTAVPNFNFTDIVACSVSEGMYYNPNNTYNYVKYYDASNNFVFTRSVVYDVKPKGPTGVVSSSFPMRLSSVIVPKEFAMQGIAFFGWTKIAKLPEVAMLIKYGHAYLNFIPGLSVGVDGFSFSITPQYAVNEDFDQYDHYKFIY